LDLVDAIATEDVALDELAKAAGLGEDYKLLIEHSKGDFLTELFSAIVQPDQPKAGSYCTLCNTPLFLYDRTYSLFGTK
jgi:hypothetical protein